MPSHPSDFAAVIGLDWADRKHDICLLETGQESPEFSVLEHDPAAIDAWTAKLRKRFDGRPSSPTLFNHRDLCLRSASGA